MMNNISSEDLIIQEYLLKMGGGKNLIKLKDEVISAAFKDFWTLGKNQKSTNVMSKVLNMSGELDSNTYAYIRKTLNKYIEASSVIKLKDQTSFTLEEATAIKRDLAKIKYIMNKVDYSASTKGFANLSESEVGYMDAASKIRESLKKDDWNISNRSVRKIKTPKAKTEAPKVKAEVPEAKAETTNAKTEEPKKKTETTKAKTEEPKPKTEEPKAKTKEPKTKTEKPKAKTEEPKAKTEEPKAKTEEPKAKTEEPKAKTEEPKAKTEEPKAKTEEPKAKTEEPKAKTEEPKAKTEEPKKKTETVIDLGTDMSKKVDLKPSSSKEVSDIIDNIEESSNIKIPEAVKETVEKEIDQIKVLSGVRLFFSRNGAPADAIRAIVSKISKISASLGKRLRAIGVSNPDIKNTLKEANTAKSISEEIVKDSAKSSNPWMWTKSVFSGSSAVIGFIAANTIGFIPAAMGAGIALATKLIPYAIAYGAYSWLTSEDGSKVRENIGILREGVKLIDEAISESELKFKDGSKGDLAYKDLVSKFDKYKASLKDVDGMSYNDKKTHTKILANRAKLLAESFTSFVENKEAHEKDLISGDMKKFIEGISNSYSFISEIDEFKSLLGKTDNGSGDVNNPITKDDPNNPKKPSKGPLTPEGGDSIYVTLYGEKIDISKMSAEKRSMMPVLIKVLSTPFGKTIADPENKWGGLVQKTGDAKKDYIQLLNLLYANDVSSKWTLRKLVRQRLSRASRGRNSGFKKALRYYRRHRNNNKTEDTDKSMDIAASLSKSINKSGYSITDFDIVMNKVANTFEKQYYSDALKGLSDDCSKLYYKEFGDLYDGGFAENNPADYNDLYRSQKESIRDAILEAHPDTVKILKSKGNGGAILNSFELHQKSLEVANSTPTGNFRSHYASLVGDLIKMADKADRLGHIKVSNLIDKTLAKITK